MHLLDDVVPNISQARPRKATTKENCTCLPPTSGFSKSFGCVLSSGSSICRFFGHTSAVKKFHLTKEEKMEAFENTMNHLADKVQESQELFTPMASFNLKNLRSYECRIGSQAANAFAGVTVLNDYVAHHHLDSNDYLNGNTCLVSLQENDVDSPQMHYLPHYYCNDPDGNGVAFRLSNGSLLIEASALEMHGSGPITKATNMDPTKRVALVFFTHRALTKANHGKKSNS
jgi:hypothetical protein